MTNSVRGVLEILEQCGDGLSCDGHLLLEGTVYGRDAVDSAVNVVAVGVANVVLHVADDDVLPVGDVHRAVFTKDSVGWAEVLVTAHEEAFGGLRGFRPIGVGFLDFQVGPMWFTPDVAGVGVPSERVLFDSSESNDVADEKVTLHGIWKMLAGNDFARSHRANLFFKKLLHFEPSAIELDLVCPTPGSVCCEVITPLVERNPVRIWGVRSVESDGVRPRVEAVHPRVAGLE